MKVRVVLVFLVLLLAAWGLWGLLYVGPAPVLVLATGRPAVGLPGTGVTATVEIPAGGVARVRLLAEQGNRSAVLGELRDDLPTPWEFWKRVPGRTARLEARLGKGSPRWLAEGKVTLRVVAERRHGLLRRPAPVVVEKSLPVRFRPPSLGVVSARHYVRQGGAGAVVFRVGPTAVRSGVRVGGVEIPSHPLPGGGKGERFCLYGVPWDLDDPAGIRLFAEDSAGNRVEQAFIDHFRRHPPRRDTIRLSDRFLRRVVPAIASRTPGFDASGTLLEQYLRINGDLRRANRAKVAELSGRSAETFSWRGRFLQLPNSARRAGYADDRTYVYRGKVVDRQVHLGLDLASTARAPVPAANGGRVLYAGWLGIYGNVVILDHGYGLLSLYAHLSTIDVKPGREVKKGEILGRTGATGLAGGDHLHLGIFVGGVAVDPIEWFDPRWIRNNLADKLPLPAD